MNDAEREAWLAERLTDNFYRWEVKCPCCDFATPNPLLMDAVQRVRNGVQAAIHVSSGCRCARHNAAVGGAANSQHLLGNALDIHTDGHFYRLLQCVLGDAAFEDGGVGTYFCRLPHRPYSWLHIDVRPTGRARWTG